ncbi:MAG: hypothetical protein HKN47_12620 [Pirellulaceae bacterium]|nr:hypothetical protein [Pirellulaceae bacterium]
MFERLATGWSLAKQAVHVLKQDKELLVFPLLSGISCLLVLASFALPLFMTGTLEALGDNPDNAKENPLVYVTTFAFYFVNYFIVTFFNSALVGCAVIRLKGGDPTVSDGFHFATSRIGQIAGWALVSATVGMILRIIESRSERVGEIVAGLLGMAWSITTFFVVPVLVIEGLGPIDAVKRSVSIMKKTWGESLAANYGVGFIVFLLSLIGILPIVAGVFLLGTNAAILGGVLIVVGIVVLLMVALISSALNSIILAALYIYAAEDRMPDGFDDGLVRTAFARH